MQTLTWKTWGQMNSSTANKNKIFHLCKRAPGVPLHASFLGQESFVFKPPDCTSLSIGGPTCTSKITDVPVPPTFLFFFLPFSSHWLYSCHFWHKATPFSFLLGTHVILFIKFGILNLNKILPHPSRCEQSESADGNHQFYLNQKTPAISSLAIFWLIT